MKNLRHITLVLCFAAMVGCGAVSTPAESTSSAMPQPAVASEPDTEDWRNVAAPIAGGGRVIYAKDGVLVLNTQNDNELVCRLITADGFDKTISVIVEDSNFQIAVQTDSYWQDTATHSTLRLSSSIDTEGRKAVISNGKMTCRLNFDIGEATVERNYARGMMEEELDSLDGLTLYSADSVGMGDGRWSDLVFAVDEWTYQFICELNNADTAVLLDKDTVAVNRIDRMEFYTAESGKLLDTKLEFDNEPDSEGNTEWDIVNMLPDREHKQLVVLTRPAQQKEGGNGWEPEYPVSMLIFDYNGKLLKQIETGLSTPLHNDNGFFYSLHMSFVDGKVHIIDGKDNFLADVAYR